MQLAKSWGSVPTRISVAGHESPSLSPPKLHDIRDEAKELARTREDVRKKRGPIRPWKKVTGVCLHHTAVVLGERPGRWASLGAHLGITRSGKIIWCHDFDRVMYHGNRWNDQTVGIEIDGHYAGIEGELHTYWRPRGKPNRKPQELTQESIDATCAAIRWICETVERNDGHVDALVAHRQSSKSRRSDPGSAIWKAIALPMSEELTLHDGGEGFEVGGYPIPEEWNPDRVGIPY